MDSINQRRIEFKPNNITILFIGESPPAGGRFFYNSNSSLYTFTQQAFHAVFGDIYSKENFLNFFMARGCFLDDLCYTPINDEKDSKKRESYREACVPSLAERIRTYNPKAIVAVMNGEHFIECVEEARRIAGFANIPFHKHLPFPGYGNDLSYVKKLIEVLQTLQPLLTS